MYYYLRMDASSKEIEPGLPADQVALAVEVFRMLADGTRIQILWALINGEMPVNDLAAAIGKPGPSVSQHLAKLRMARLVRTRRDGTQIFYQLENDHVRELIVDAVHNAEHAGPAIPAHHLVRGGGVTPIPEHRDHANAAVGTRGHRR
jgi:DNA-binding transcriptional ArsR family regulator